ncbi:WD40 repeat-like protein [Meira miltonrushii]|uniref:non-specific serine/threonine protein kinase n=1 Tax=Meira miltonrushii TaxID=1280837 RepID=A0A316VL60_9BASI|nr:WD40 repeat-like protein [Meira miltonrushii]PWN36275.1 WD40 repeat-like protein [Meira miltonrushii]
MGATSSTAANQARLPIGVNNLVGELGNDVQYEKGMGSSRFLKAIKARHKHGPLVVKTFVKPEANLSLRPLVRRIRIEREALADVPNTLTYQKVVETETAGYLIRQWMANNLYDRISTRPFLTNIEKKWITYQLLSAMKEARRRNVPHGDLKSENILVTSSLSVYVTDFASSFKQVYLPLNDPSDFNFYFGTSGRRTCYVAPERFYSEDSEIAKQKAKARNDAASLEAQKNGSSNDQNVDIMAELFKRDGKVTEAMDVFSLGCVIAELWRDGAPIFTLMQLFKYREGQFDIESALMEITDYHIRSMVRSMLSLDPSKRGTFSDYMEKARGTCFPDSFYTFLHRYLTTLQRTSARTASMAAAEAAAALKASVNANLPPKSSSSNAPPLPSHLTSAASEAGTSGAVNEVAYLLRAEADERIERMYEEWSVVSNVMDGKPHDDLDAIQVTPSFARAMSPREEITTPNLDNTDPMELDKETERIDHILPVRLCIPGIEQQVLTLRDKPITGDGTGLLILSPLLANLRNALRPSTKMHCFDLLLHLSANWLTDEAKLDRVLPYVINMFDDESIMVRVAAVRTATQLLSLVDTITPSNASTFTEYIMPNMRLILRDSSSLVRGMYASCLVELSRIGIRFLQITSAMRAEGIFAADADGRTGGDADDFLEGEPRPEDEVNFDRQMDVSRAFFREQVTVLLTDPSPVVKRSLVSNIGPLCVFFGSTLANDVILSHMITYLNDRSWLLRKAFFDAIVEVAQVAGARSVEDYISTLLLQALSDPEESVILHVLQGLRRMLNVRETSKALLSQSKVLDIAAATAGFLCHPNHWLRTASSLVVEACAEQLHSVDVWAILYPAIRPLLRSDVKSIQGENLLFAAKDPLSREVLQKAVQWAFRAKNSKFWKPVVNNDFKGKAGLGNGLGREGVGLMIGRKAMDITRTPVPRNEEDDAHFDSLRSSGLNEDDEVKLIALREYITKLAKMSNLIGQGIKASTSTSLVNHEDASLLPPLQIKSSLAVQPLDDVTPLTIFFTSKNHPQSQTQRSLPAETASIRSQTADSTFSGRMARRRLAGGRIVSEVGMMSPLEELRRRMNEANSSADGDILALPATPTAPLEFGQTDFTTPLRPGSPSSVLSGGATSHALQSRLAIGVSKAQAAIASNPTNVTGKMAEGSAKMLSITDREQVIQNAVESGRTTPNGSVTPLNRAGLGRQTADVTGNEPTFSSTYDGNDPYIRAHLEAIYLSNFQDRHPGWGPAITATAPMRRKAGMSAKAATSAGARIGSVGAPTTSVSSNRRPEGNLIAYFTEHTAPISSIVISPDHAFFLSGSEDGTIKVWDTARLEKNVTSRSRGTYNGQRGKIVCLVMLNGSHCVASAATDGSVHVVRVEVGISPSAPSSLPRYGKIRMVSNFQLSDPEEYVVCMVQSSRKSGVSTKDAALTTSSGSASLPVGGGVSTSSMNASASGSTLILATSKSHIVILDLRTMQVLTNFENPAHLGAIAAMCVDPQNIWLLIGTIGGVMCLWDLRFHLLVKTWRLSTLEKERNGTKTKSTTAQDDAEDAFAHDGHSMIRLNSIALHPSRGDGRWVMIACERLNIDFQGVQNGSIGHRETLIETWDIESAECVEVYNTIRHDGPTSQPSGTQTGNEDEVLPLQQYKNTSSTTSHDRFTGLGSAAEAIERLVKMHEARLNQAPDETTDNAGPTNGQEEETGTYRRTKKKEVIQPPPPTSFVRSMLVAVEGYTSGNLPHAAQVSGGWLDAGKLAATSNDNAHQNAGDGPAGYMITGGMDKRIRFWDLGKVEKSTSFGAPTDERNEFRVKGPESAELTGGAKKKSASNGLDHRSRQTTRSNAPQMDEGAIDGNAGLAVNGTDSNSETLHATTFTHQLHPTSATARAATTSLRSPLLTHQTNSATSTMLMKAHKDAITSLAIIESPFRCIVAGDYAGNIRVWE